MRRAAVLAAAVALIVVAVVAGKIWLDGKTSSGPLTITGKATWGIPLEDGQTATWGMPLPELDQPATLQAVEPLGVNGIDVLGVTACVGSTLQSDGSHLHCAPNAYGWPPAGVSTQPIAGTAFASNPSDTPGVLIGVRRTSNGRTGTIGSLRITYVVDGRTYVAVEPWSLELTLPEASPAPLGTR